MRSLRSLAASVRRRLFPPIVTFLRQCKGVIHIGANVGQERHTYAAHNLRVVWIEPVPEQFAALQANIRDLPRQTAIHALVTDTDGEYRKLHVSNNNGESSSIFTLHLHKNIWPEVVYTHDIRMPTTTLPTLLAAHSIDLTHYDALVLDTQGSELLILKGAASRLADFQFIKTEAADFESYNNCGTTPQIQDFLARHNFILARRVPFARLSSAGEYCDLLFKRK